MLTVGSQNTMRNSLRYDNNSHDRVQWSPTWLRVVKLPSKAERVRNAGHRCAWVAAPNQGDENLKQIRGERYPSARGINSMPYGHHCPAREFLGYSPKDTLVFVGGRIYASNKLDVLDSSGYLACGLLNKTP